MLPKTFFIREIQEMLKIVDLTFGYGKKILFQEASLFQKTGEVLALVGPSGSGKSTLFKLLTGLVRGYSGSIHINGYFPLEARKYLTYMTQHDLLLPWRTVIDNLVLVGELQDKKGETSKEELYERALLLLNEVGLAGFYHYFPHQLSGGMRQRVCLARSLFLARPFLLLDEPFGALDRKTRHEMYLLLKRMKMKYGLSILFITHDVFDLYELADRVYILDEGEIRELSMSSDMPPECRTLIFGHETHHERFIQQQFRVPT